MARILFENTPEPEAPASPKEPEPEWNVKIPFDVVRMAGGMVWLGQAVKQEGARFTIEWSLVYDHQTGEPSPFCGNSETLRGSECLRAGEHSPFIIAQGRIIDMWAAWQAARHIRKNVEKGTDDGTHI